MTTGVRNLFPDTALPEDFAVFAADGENDKILLPSDGGIVVSAACTTVTGVEFFSYRNGSSEESVIAPYHWSRVS